MLSHKEWLFHRGLLIGLTFLVGCFMNDSSKSTDEESSYYNSYDDEESTYEKVSSADRIPSILNVITMSVLESDSSYTEDDNSFHDTTKEAPDSGEILKSRTTMHDNGRGIESFALAASSTDEYIKCPTEHKQLSVNLNDGTDGNWVYLCYKKITGMPVKLISGINILSTLDNQLGSAWQNENELPPLQSKPVPSYRHGMSFTGNFDINNGTGGEWFQTLFTFINTEVSPIKEIILISATTSLANLDLDEYEDEGWNFIDYDLNRGTGGNWVYIGFINHYLKN